MTRSRTYIATPPGATIKEQLTDRGMSQKEFAARMDMSEKHISKLINGDVQLTQDVALRLEVVLGIDASFWTNLEVIYREKLSRVQAENSIDADVELAKNFPYNEMVKFEWVPRTNDSRKRVSYLRRYFEVVSLRSLDNNTISRIACRRLVITEKSDLALLAWVQKARIEARGIDTKSFNMHKLINSIGAIRQMTTQNPDAFCPELKSILSECGIALVILPRISGSYLQGASFKDGNKIVLGITVRGKDADKFWFSLFHELAHIMLGHIGYPDGTTTSDEQDADAWARDALIPRDEYIRFVSEDSYSDYSVRLFADNIGIAPGIVVGRLQNDGKIEHNMLNQLKEQYEIVL